MERTIELLVKIALAPETPQGANQRKLYRKALEEHWTNHQVAVKTEQTKSNSAGPKVNLPELLLNLGMPAHVLGYTYVQTAIHMVMDDSKLCKNITTEVYPRVAQTCGSTASRVERAIRHAIEAMCDRGDMDFQAKVFGNSISFKRGKPTNAEFLCCVANYVKRMNGMED